MVEGRGELQVQIVLIGGTQISGKNSKGVFEFAMETGHSHNEDGTEEIWAPCRQNLSGFALRQRKHSPVIQWGCGFSRQSQFLHLYVRLQFTLMNLSMQA